MRRREGLFLNGQHASYDQQAYEPVAAIDEEELRGAALVDALRKLRRAMKPNQQIKLTKAPVAKVLASDHKTK